MLQQARRLFQGLLTNLFGFERPETRGEVIFFRLFELLVLIFVVRLAWQWGRYIQGVDDVVEPRGLGQYVDVSFMLDPNVALVVAGLIAGLSLLGFFRVTRYAYIAALLLLHVQYVTRFSFGKLPHGTNMLGMVFLGLGVAMLIFHEARYRRRFALGFAYFFVGMGYFFAACCKLIRTGIDWPAGQHLWMWISQSGMSEMANAGIFGYNVLQSLVLEHHLLATAFLAAGLLTELSAVALWWRAFRVPVALALIGVHTGIFFVMGIDFRLSIYLLILLGLPWSRWIDVLLSYTDRLVYARQHRR